MKNRNTKLNSLSNFYCTCCGHKGIPIIRKPGRFKEPGHLKKLFCLYCQEEKNMVEIKNNGTYTLEDFNKEYKYGNFTPEGERKMPYRQFLAYLRKKKVIDNE